MRATTAFNKMLAIPGATVAATALLLFREAGNGIPMSGRTSRGSGASPRSKDGSELGTNFQTTNTVGVGSHSQPEATSAPGSVNRSYRTSHR